MVDVFNVAVGTMILLLTLGTIYLISTNLIEGQISPMIKSMNPNSTTGISGSEYNSLIDKLSKGNMWMFYIFLAIPFLYIAVKLLYEREPTSVYGG